jgi:hypothetical protein
MKEDDQIVSYIYKRLDYLMGSRPTAVDLANAIRLLKRTATDSKSPGSVREAYITAAEKILEDDLSTNLAIGRYGAEFLRRNVPPDSARAQANFSPAYNFRYPALIVRLRTFLLQVPQTLRALPT